MEKSVVKGKISRWDGAAVVEERGTGSFTWKEIGRDCSLISQGEYVIALWKHDLKA